MQCAVKSGRAENDLIRTLPGILDEFLQGLPGLLIVGDEHAGICDETRKRDKISIGEFRLTAEQPVNFGKTRDRGDMRKKGVAVRPGVSGNLGSNLSRGTRLGIDDDRLLDDGVERRSKRPCDDVGSPS